MNSSLGHSPALWEIELRVVQLACEHTGISNSRVTSDSRLLEDLGLDSLDLVEFIMTLEESFAVTLPEESGKEIFVGQSPTLRHLAQWVLQQWGTGTPERRGWFAKKNPPSQMETMPFTQLGGLLSKSEWMDGQLYEPLGKGREGFPQFRRKTDGMRCIVVPQGDAMIGNGTSSILSDQHPAHRVPYTSFLIDAEPISNLAFSRFLNSLNDIDTSVVAEWCEVGDARRAAYFQLKRSFGKWKPIAHTEHLPAILVSWYGANAYSLWANRRDWRYYRGDGQIPTRLQNITIKAEAPPREWLSSFLPSEGQWEYVARGGDSRQFPWGDEAPTLEKALFAQHRLRDSYEAANLPSADVSARLGMSPFGVHHMAGNVWQWCRDWYSSEFYKRPEAQMENAQNSLASGIRNERGGSWIGPAELCSSTYRRGRPQIARGRCLGFRCAGKVEDLP